MTYFIGIAFLFFISVLIALFCQSVIKNRFFVLAASTILAAAVLKTWAYFDIGGFDLEFLILVLGVALAAALTVDLLLNFRKSTKLYLRES